jgi:hypothetical protein
MDHHVLLPSPVFGRHAQVIAKSLAILDIPCKIPAGGDELVFELLFEN